MGRHSAADDDADDAAVTTATLEPVDDTVARGRHARSADDQVDGGTVALRKEPKPPKVKKVKPPKPAKEPKQGGTRADLRLLRENGLVRACCLGVVLLAFLVYTVVMIALDKAGSYLFWLWIPIVASGVLVGAVLDLAYRSQDRKPKSTS